MRRRRPVQVPALLAEIDRLKRKALSRGVNLQSPHEDVPAEDVAMLRQVFAIADDTGDGTRQPRARQLWRGPCAWLAEVAWLDCGHDHVRHSS